MALCLAGCWHGAAAHEIPSDITVHAFVRPAGERLQFLVRLPLKSMRDIDFPEREGGCLDVEKLAPLLPDAAKVWISDFAAIYEDGRLLDKPRVAATQISLPSDTAFISFDEAMNHTTGPKLSNSANIYWDQVLFDVLFEYAIHSERSRFSIRPGMERLAARVVVGLRFLPPGGAVRAYELRGDPGVVDLDPVWGQAAWRFVKLGFFHILDGTDHLLFLLCLVIPFRRLGALVKVVTAFTVAHSITLIGSAYDLTPGVLWFPPLIETLIAASIVYMALENIIGRSTVHRRWMMAFGFGLVHGFGFSFALRDTLQFAGSHLLTSLVSFNAGVELGQLLVLLVLVPVLGAVFRFVAPERTGTIVLSALVAHTGWHWMIERWEHLRQFRFVRPTFNAALLATAVDCLIAIVLLLGLIRAAVWVHQRWQHRPEAIMSRH